jgi:putative membrane protein
MRVQNGILVALAALTVASLINSEFPADQYLHHVPTVLALVVLYASRRFFPMSTTAFVLVALFLLLHIIGARWVYSNVPYVLWVERLFGVSMAAHMDAERNHYDRFVHMAFGLLITFPIYEQLAPRLRAHRVWALGLTVTIILAVSALYELVEWSLAVTLASDAAHRYLGQQGDIWDGQKDMSLAFAGAVLAMTLTALYHAVRGREPYLR